MHYDIKRGTLVIANIAPNGVQSKQIMGENVVRASFSMTSAVEFAIGDYADFFGERYWIKKLPEIAKNANNDYDYRVEFQGVNYELDKSLFKGYSADNRLRTLKFSVMANAVTFLSLVVANLNRTGSGGWKVGVVDAPESDYKNLTFSSESCLSVLSRLATEFNTEFWIDPDKTIHLSERGTDSGRTFKYGKGNGLYSISRTNVSNDFFTVLVPEGGSRNLPGNYKGGGVNLQLPSGLENLQKNVDKYGWIEYGKTFEDIFPSRVGVISSVKSPFIFSDAGIDFDLNAQLIPGVSAKVSFLTGQLAGYTFDIAADGYNHSLRQITIRKSQDEKNLDIPSALLAPIAGDKYIFTDIIMPDSYISDAETKLQTKAQEYLDQNSTPKVQYGVVLDSIKAKYDNISLQLGNTVNIIDDPLKINGKIRISGIVRDIQNIYKYDISLNSSIYVTSIVRQYQELKDQKRAIERNDLNDPAKTRRRYKDMAELMSMMYDPEGNLYPNFKAGTIQAEMIEIGSRSQAFNLIGVTLECNYLADPNKVRISSGRLDHFTIDPAKLKSWFLTAFAKDNLVSSTAYYIYAKCEKNGINGIFLISTQKILINEDPNYYHFWIGVIHSVQDGVRGHSFTYGESFINGKFITTGRIQSLDGNTYFDLDNGEIGGLIKFRSNGILKTVDVVIDEALSSYQPDGQIILWDYPYAPTLTNVPASQWNTAALKDDHLGDLFYDTLHNVGYKFTKSGTSYVWAVETDSGLIKAMKAASIAQDTADNKRRIFTAQPVPPYDIGDLWAPGTSAYTQVCIVSRQTGLFTASDWRKADKSTDDTVANSAVQSAASAQNAANAANTRLAQIASDNVLSKEEKAGELREWQAIQGEKANLDAQAAKYGVSAVSYDNAYNSLNTYLNGGSDPLLGNLTTDSSIVGTTYRATWNAYYNAKVALLKSISDVGYKVEKARLGTTVIDGGYVLTSLINTSALIVSGSLETTSGSQSKVDTLKTSLGSLAYDDLVQFSKLGTTIIDGSYIKTTLLDAAYIKASIINVGYIQGLSLNFTQGTIGGWNISSANISSAINGNSISMESSTGTSDPQITMQNAAGFGGQISPRAIYIVGIGRSNNNTLNGVTDGATAVAYFVRPEVTTSTVTEKRGQCAIYARTAEQFGYAIITKGDSYFDGALYINATLKLGQIESRLNDVNDKPVYYNTVTQKFYIG